MRVIMIARVCEGFSDCAVTTVCVGENAGSTLAPLLAFTRKDLHPHTRKTFTSFQHTHTHTIIIIIIITKTVTLHNA